MAALDIATRLAIGHPARGAGTDAERRAASWLASQIRTPRRDAELEPFWCRPNWALAQAWYVALGLAGSLISVSHPKVGGALVLAGLAGLIADASGWPSPARLLTFEAASQNVVSRASSADPRVRLIVTANYDAGRSGVVYGRRMRATATAMRRILGRAAPGYAGTIALLLGWLVAVAIARNAGTRHGAGIAVAQLVPTFALVVALALLLELALNSPALEAAGDNATGTALAVQLVRALDAAPPANLAVELVLTGAGDAGGIGLRAHLRNRRPKPRPPDVVVLGLAACGAGSPQWWVSDGQLVPLRYLPRLGELSAAVAAADPQLRALPHHGCGAGPALPARSRGLPAITIGCLDATGLPPHTHTDDDTVDRLEPQALDAALVFALALVDEIDAEVGRLRARGAPAAAPQLVS
jgi:hypothetical protein